MTDRLKFQSLEAKTPAQRRREALAALEERAAKERRQVGGPDSLVQRIRRGEEERPWWMEEV